MNRQYVGARYVPKFSDLNNGDWSNIYSYEALTIVKNGYDFYTSKIPVPAGVDISDTTYWVKTGEYNGAIISLDSRIAALEKIKTVEKRADIASLTCESGDVIHALNSYSGDGIDTYWIVSSGTASGYLTIQLSGGLMASLIHDKDIHAHMVGAFPDGSDCKAAIDEVLSTVSSAQIYFNEGTYNFSGRIWLNDYQALIGENWKTILYCTQDPVEDHGEFIGIIKPGETLVKGCRIENLAISMYVGGGEDVNAIGIVNAQDIIIDHVKVIRSNWRGFQFEAAGGIFENILVRNCEIHDTDMNGIGLSHTSGGSIKNVRFENIRIYNPKSSYGGILIEGIDNDHMKNVVLDDIYIHTTSDVPRALYLLNAANVTINNLTVESSATAASYLIQAQSDNNTMNIKFNNVHIVAENTSNSVIGMGLFGGSDYIINNIRIDKCDLGIRIPTYSSIAQNVLITNIIGNTLRNPVYVDPATVKGFVTALLSANAIQSYSPDFKEITA